MGGEIFNYSDNKDDEKRRIEPEVSKSKKPNIFNKIGKFFGNRGKKNEPAPLESEPTNEPKIGEMKKMTWREFSKTLTPNELKDWEELHLPEDEIIQFREPSEKELKTLMPQQKEAKRPQHYETQINTRPKNKKMEPMPAPIVVTRPLRKDVSSGERQPAPTITSPKTTETSISQDEPKPTIAPEKPLIKTEMPPIDEAHKQLVESLKEIINSATIKKIKKLTDDSKDSANIYHRCHDDFTKISSILSRLPEICQEKDIRLAKDNVIKRLKGVLSSFQNIESILSQENVLAMAKGDIKQWLQEEGLFLIDVRPGKDRFDPGAHEAFMSVKKIDLPNDLITSVSYAGFKDEKGRLIERPKVVVNTL